MLEVQNQEVVMVLDRMTRRPQTTVLAAAGQVTIPRVVYLKEFLITLQHRQLPSMLVTIVVLPLQQPLVEIRILRVKDSFILVQLLSVIQVSSLEKCILERHISDQCILEYLLILTNRGHSIIIQRSKRR